MKKILLFDTSYGTRNMGDFIINEAIMDQMSFLFDENFLIRFGTHNPILHHYQLAFPNSVNKITRDVDLKFLGGTNLFKANLRGPISDWSIDILTASLYRGAISLGCGFAGDAEGKMDKYTQKVYKRALSREFVHSVRDEATKSFLNRLGYEAYNTGCPTLWGFTEETKVSIPDEKAENVIFTLTDYMKDPQRDRKLIEILKRNYKEVNFWVQGSRDLEYLQKLTDTQGINIIRPNLKSYRDVLATQQVDYIGTRLHAGIFAMQHGIRSIIITVDNRARDMSETSNLNVIEREDIDSLPAMLNSRIITDIRIDHELIKAWKSQFEVK